jgi:hypothetical protein
MTNPTKERFRQNLDRALYGFTRIVWPDPARWEAEPPPTTLTHSRFTFIVRNLCDTMGLDNVRAERFIYWGLDTYWFDIDAFFRLNGWTVEVTRVEATSTAARPDGDSLLVLTHDDGETQREFTRPFDPMWNSPVSLAEHEIARLEAVHKFSSDVKRTVRFVDSPVHTWTTMKARA